MRGAEDMRAGFSASKTKACDAWERYAAARGGGGTFFSPSERKRAEGGGAARRAGWMRAMEGDVDGTDVRGGVLGA